MTATPDSVSTVDANTASSDNYLWTATGDSSWSDAGNWSNVITGDDPATSAPGGSDVATLVSDLSSYLTVIGPGAAASLLINGAICLDGTFITGTFEVDTAGDSASVDILSGGCVTVGTSLAVGDNGCGGTVTIESGGTLMLSGTASVAVGGAATNSATITVTGAQALLDTSDASPLAPR